MDSRRSPLRGLAAVARGLVFLAGAVLGLDYALTVLWVASSTHVYYGALIGGLGLAIAAPWLWWRSLRDDRPLRLVCLYVLAWAALIGFLWLPLSD